MFEMEDYSSGYHEGYFSKFADNAESMLDCYVSDSLQDMLDIDIRSEIANVVGGGTDISAMVGEFPLDDAANAISSNKNNTNNNSSISGGNSLSSLGSSSWMGPSSWVSSYSSSNDFYVDLGACVNPISVMPLISSSLMHASPIATNLNAAATTAQSPVSPMNDINKSHLTFSPAQMKVSAGSIRHEQLVSHIPKQIVTIPTAMGGGGQTMAPATMATNAALQRKLGQMSSQVDVVKKDLNKINKVNANAPVTALVSLKTLKAMKNQNINNNNNKSTINLNESTIAINGLDNTNTIKLAPGIGGLTFANSITYNKLKQQSAVKSPQGSPVTANGNIVLKRDRDASPLHNMTTLNGNKMLARNANGTYTPKGIASAANSPHHHLQHMRASSPAQSISMSPTSSHSSSSSSSASFSPSTSTTTTTNNNNHHNHNSNNNSHQQQQQQYPTYINGIHNNNNNNNNSNNINNYQNINFKSLQQKAKVVATSVNNHMSIGGNNGGSGASGEILENDFPKPAYSYSCLIAMALKNSRSGSLPVSEIYSFMCEHFPYFKSAPSGWKNSVRHNLSLNKCFEKIEKPATNGNQRKGCLWAMNPERIAKMDEEVQKWSRKDPMAIRNAMIYPEHLEALERGDMKHGSADSDIELDSQSEVEEVSDLEEQEIEDVFIDNCLVEDVEVDDDESFGTLVAHTESDIANNNNNNQNNNHQNNKNNTNNTMVEVVETKLRRINNNFDIEVEDIYDAMDMEDDKSNITMQVNPCDSLIEIVTSDSDVSQTTLKTKQKPMQSQQQQHNGAVVVSVAEFQNAKRPRLAYAISNQSQSLSQQQPQQPPKQQQSAQIALQRQQQINKQQLIQLQQQLKQQQQNNNNNNNNNGVTNNSTIPVNTTSSMPMKKVKVIQQQQPPLQQKNQHNIIVHTLSNNTTNTSSLASSVSSASSPTTTTLMNGGNVVTTVLSNSQYAQLANLQQQQQQQQQRRKVQLVSRMA